jgi:hypothetical protein
MPSAPPDVAEAFSQTRLLIIAAGKIADGGDETHDYALRSVISAAEEKFTVALDWFEAEAWEERKASEPIAPAGWAKVDAGTDAAAPAPIADRVRYGRELVQVADDINAARYLIECAWMAAENLDDDDQKNAIQSVLSIARDDKLDAARDRLKTVARGAKQAVSPIDPVFAAIKRHKALWDALPPILAAVDKVAASLEGREITAADKEAERQADDAIIAARVEFEATIPTTIAGLRAALEHAVEMDRDSIPQIGGRIAPTLLKSPVLFA